MNGIRRLKTKFVRQVRARCGARLLSIGACTGFVWTLILLAVDTKEIMYTSMFLPEISDNPQQFAPPIIGYSSHSNRSLAQVVPASNDTNKADVKELPDPSFLPSTIKLNYELQPNPFSYDLDKNTIHILIAMDKKKLAGLPAFINSVVKSTKSAPVRFHLLWCSDNSQMIKQYLACFDIPNFNQDSVNIIDNPDKFLPSVFKKFMKLISNAGRKVKSCSSIMGLQAHRIFTYLDRVLWLDTDMIIQADLQELWQSDMEDKYLLYARNENQNAPSLTYERILGRNKHTTDVQTKYKQRYGKEFQFGAEAFSSEISLLNLHRWREMDSPLQRDYAYWMHIALNTNGNDVLSSTPWWFYSDRAIMWFAFKQEVTSFQLPGWNCDGLGWKLREEITYHKARESKLLHWNGEKKPWLDSTSPHIGLYLAHVPTQCGGKGECIEQKAHNTSSKAPFIYQCPESNNPKVDVKTVDTHYKSVAQFLNNKTVYPMHVAKRKSPGKFINTKKLEITDKKSPVHKNQVDKVDDIFDNM